MHACTSFIGPPTPHYVSPAQYEKVAEEEARLCVYGNMKDRLQNMWPER